jgi:hypothetical protein
MSFGSSLIGFTLGKMNFGGLGVVMGAMVGLIFGSMFLLVSYIKQIGFAWSSFIIPRDMPQLLVLSALLTFLCNIIQAQQSSIMVVIGISLLASVPLLILGWFHPVRKLFLDRGKYETKIV